jgi:hypothetical protein
MDERNKVKRNQHAIFKLTNLAQHLNAALASGQFHDVSDVHVWRHIEDGSIFEFLQERLGFSLAITALDPVDRLELILEWENMRDCVEPFKFDSDRLGFCLLIGYLLEGIARRSQKRDYRLTLEMCGAAVPGGELNQFVGE